MSGGGAGAWDVAWDGRLIAVPWRRSTDLTRDSDHDRSTAPAAGRPVQGSNEMLGQLHQELARQKHREAYIEARRIRLLRAARAERRARRAAEIAVRACERVHSEAVVARA